MTDLSAPTSNRCEERIKKPSGMRPTGFDVVGLSGARRAGCRTYCGLGTPPRGNVASVAVALCEAYGYLEIDIATVTPQDEVAAARQVLAACAG